MDEKEKRIGITLTVGNLRPEEAVKVSEQLSRIQVGFALEGYAVALNLMTFDAIEELD
jgi:hypothetical protein